MPFNEFLPYLIVMTVITYLVRVVPFTLFKKKIKNKFVNSFLFYTPYAVLAAMTFPAILYATNNVFSAIAGLAIAILLALFGKSLLTVACGACLSVFVVELLFKLI